MRTRNSGPATIDFKEDLFFAKLDWEFSDRDRIELSVKIRDETSDGDQTGTGVAAQRRRRHRQRRQALRAVVEAQRRTLAQRGAADLRRCVLRSAIINADVNGAVYTWFDGARTSNILAVDGADPRAGQNKGQKGWAIADIITFTDISWGAGDHTIKAGVKYKDVDLTAAGLDARATRCSTTT